MSSAPEQHASAAIHQWRARVLDLVFAIGFATVTIALVVRLREDLTYGADVASPYLVPSWILIGIGFFWRRGPYEVRKTLLVIAFLMGVALIASHSGFLLPNPFVATLMLSVWAALFLGARGAWLTWGLSMLTWVWIAWHNIHTGATIAGAVLDIALPENWVRVLTIYGTLTAGTVATVRFLVTRLESAMRRSDALIRALETESEQRIAALEEQRQLEVQLEQSQKLQSLGTLAGGVAHDFNNLLVVILGNAEMIAEDAGHDTDTHAAAEDIKAAAARATALTRQLLAFGRQRVEQRAPIDISANVEESMRLLRRVLPERIRLHTELAPDLLRAWGPPTVVEQILLNLCVNARDAIVAEGTITVRTTHVRRRAPGTTRERAFVLLSVEDDGHGMTDETRRRVFDPFFTTKAPGQGTGLGLSMVHGLVEQCRGFIEVESAPNEGTRFDVFFAVHQAGPDSDADAASQPTAGAGETVLVVDDDAAVREVVVTALRRAGYETIEAEDGEAGVTTYREHAARIRLVITDVVMPKKGAVGMHDAIVATGADVPFLVLSGYAEETLDETFFERAGRAFLAKPFSNAELLSTARALLDGRIRAKPTSGSTAVIRSEPR